MWPREPVTASPEQLWNTIHEKIYAQYIDHRWWWMKSEKEISLEYKSTKIIDAEFIFSIITRQIRFNDNPDILHSPTKNTHFV